MKVTHVSNPESFVGYYLDQAGYGRGEYFQGTRMQRGYGIGSLFGKLFRFAMPLLKRGTKHVGQALARTGLNIAADAVQGGDIKDSARLHLKNVGRSLAEDAAGYIKSQVGQGRKRKRLNHRPRHKAPSLKRARHDIFSS